MNDTKKMSLQKFVNNYLLASTTLLHDFCPGEPRKLTEAIRTINDRVIPLHLCIPKNKIAICNTKWREKNSQPKIL